MLVSTEDFGGGVSGGAVSGGEMLVSSIRSGDITSDVGDNCPCQPGFQLRR